MSRPPLHLPLSPFSPRADYEDHILSFRQINIYTQPKRTFSDIRPVSGVCTVPRLSGGESAGRCRGCRPRCAGVTAAGGVSAVTRGIEPREAPVGLVPEVTLRPDCKTHRTLLQCRLGARLIHIYSRPRPAVTGRVLLIPGASR